MKRTAFARFAALFLVLCLSLSCLTACSPYRLELSNARESEVMMKVGEYEIAFEVINFFYHNYKAVVDGGDSSVWEGADAALYHEKLMKRALDAACELYAVFAVSKDLGLDPYGPAIEEQMEEGIRAVIDSYPARRDYIEDLKDQHMTDTVYRLLMRSYFCQQYLLAYADGISNISDEALREFCEDENVLNVLVLTVYFEASTLPWAQERAATIMGELENCITDEQFRTVAIKYATSLTSEMERGTYMTLRELRRLANDESITPKTGDILGPYFDATNFVVLRVTEKDLGSLQENSESVRACYLEYLIEEKTAALYEAHELTEAGKLLTAESFA